MEKQQAKEIMKIIDTNVEEVLDKYLSYDLVRRIKTEIVAGVEWDLANMEGEN